MKIMLISIPWMKYYTGEGDEENITPLSGYVFQYVNGNYYGYGEGLSKIAIEELDGVLAEDESAKDVLVVWVSKNREDQNKIIGWYKEAEVFRNEKKALTLDSDRVELCYSIKAEAEKCTLLPPELRLFDIKDLESSLVFEKDIDLIKDVTMYIHNYQGEKLNKLLNPKDLTAESVLNFSELEMFFEKADEFLAKDLYGKALRCFNKVIALEPELTNGYECKGSILLSLKMYDEALKVYKKITEIEKDHEEAGYCLGLLYGLTGDYIKCIQHLDAYIEKNKQDANAIGERGIAYYNLGKWQLAKADFEAAYQMEKDNPVFKKLLQCSV